MLESSRKIVIKVGSNTLSDKDGFVNEKFIEELCNQVSQLKQQGKEVIIVSSGAKVAGISTINKWSRKSDINYKQALCAIGQVRLLGSYERCFEQHNIHIGQVLLTRDDFFIDSRVLNIRNTLFTLIDEGVVPIINENDTVCIKELQIGDNDTLAAYTATLWNADTLIILSDIDGLYNKNPKTDKDAKLVELVEDVDSIIKDIEIGEANEFGTGGIKTKLDAAKICNDYEISMILANGKIDNIITKIYNNEIKYTLFKKCN
ncbi:MAG: glutamate 5-kinase [Epulopiscium sp. Nuni2H_MBin003]|nr:MAG: glutamate 5-kinase [Epulopiscium sp. Nuni2H_MBin003]